MINDEKYVNELKIDLLLHNLTETTRNFYFVLLHANQISYLLDLEHFQIMSMPKFNGR